MVIPATKGKILEVRASYLVNFLAYNVSLRIYIFCCAKLCVCLCTLVWIELEKENKEFFEAYTKEKEERASEMATMQRIQKMLHETAARDADDDED